jgi:N-acetylglutamate synthase
MSVSMDCVFDVMSVSDYDETVAFWKKQEGVGLNESDSREAIAFFLNRNAGMSFVVRQGGKIVGAALCGTDGRRGYLHHVAVDSSLRGKGLGRKLVERCLAELSKAGISRCNIFLFADNVEGETFWKKMGYRVRCDLKIMQRVMAADPKNSCAC